MGDREGAQAALQGDTTQQTGEQRRAAILGSAPTALTATGQARAQLLGTEDERLSEIEDRGSTAETIGGEPKPDLGGRTVKNREGQDAPAAFVVNGLQPAAMVASPGGLQPVSLVASDPDDAQAKLEQRRDDAPQHPRARDELSETQVAALDAPSLRAVAESRGYKDFPRLGAEGTRREFLRRQGEDRNFRATETPIEEASTPAPAPSVV